MSKNATFQSGADFWGPGTPTIQLPTLLSLLFQSGADFWGPGTCSTFVCLRCSQVSIRCGFLGSGDWQVSIRSSCLHAGFNPVRISGVRGLLVLLPPLRGQCFNPVRISGVRGPVERGACMRNRESFNPVRISGVRGLVGVAVPAPSAAGFQSGADFWGPGTRDGT